MYNHPDPVSEDDHSGDINFIYCKELIDEEPNPYINGVLPRGSGASSLRGSLQRQTPTDLGMTFAHELTHAIQAGCVP